MDEEYEGEFCEALLEAFPSERTLARMVRRNLGENLEEITEPGSLTDRVEDLLKWASSNGKFPDLLEASREANRGNPKLAEFAKKFASRGVESSRPGSDNIPPPSHQIAYGRTSAPMESVEDGNRVWENLELQLSDYRSHEGVERFSVLVAKSPNGDTTQHEEVVVPQDLRDKIRQLESRQLALPGMIALGEQLAELLFPPAACKVLRQNLAIVQERGTYLRIEIGAISYAVSDLPWEYCYIASLNFSHFEDSFGL